MYRMHIARIRLACWFRRSAETIFFSFVETKFSTARTRSPARETGELPGPCRLDQRVAIKQFLSAGKLVQRRFGHVARALVSQIPGIQCGFSSQSFWNAGSPRKGSHVGSSLKCAGVMGVP